MIKTLLLALVAMLITGCASRQSGVVQSAGRPHVIQSIVPKANAGRPLHRRMNPSYITVHSTQNRSAGAHSHAVAMANGRLKAPRSRSKYSTWHFTVDAHSIYQSLPVNETGEHADYEGRGNRQSIGIEMCENGGQSATINNTARLIAWLMREYRIPLGNVVPHQHWRRVTYTTKEDMGYKNCPRILLERDGRLGPKWTAFKQQIKSYAER